MLASLSLLSFYKFVIVCQDGAGQACHNRLNLSDCEKMLSYITNVVINADEKEVVTDAINVKWKVKGIEYKILKAERDRTDVRVVNNPALKGTRMRTFDM